MFCGEIISNFVDSSEYYDKSRLYIMNGGQRSNRSTVSWMDLLLVRHYSIQYYFILLRNRTMSDLVLVVWTPT